MSDGTEAALEYWLLHNPSAQAEGEANLDKAPEAGALIAIGFAKPMCGDGVYARYIANAPRDWTHGVSVREIPGAPLPIQLHPLKLDANVEMRPTLWLVPACKRQLARYLYYIVPADTSSGRHSGESRNPVFSGWPGLLPPGASLSSSAGCRFLYSDIRMIK